MAKSKFTTQQFISAMPGTGGVISEIASKVGCAWNTAKTYISKHSTVLQAWQNERSRITDKARHNIIDSILAGDLQMSKWWLTVMDEEFRPPQKHELSTGDKPFTVKVVRGVSIDDL